MTSLKVTFGVFLFGILALTSCRDQETVSSTEQQKLDEQKAGSPKGDIQPLAVCAGATGVTITGPTLTGTTIIGDYCAWGRISYAFCSGTGPTLWFEGQFNSFIRPAASTTWFIGTIPIANYSSSWATILPLISYKPGSPGSIPNAAGVYDCTYSPDPVATNVVGLQGTNTTWGLGYYGYVNRVATPNQAIVIWSGGTSTASNATNAVDKYAILVTSLTPTISGSNYTSKVVFNYRGITP